MTLKRQPRIARLDLAVVTLPDSHPESSSSPSVDVFGYVIDHPEGPIVFDTGVGTDNAFIDQIYEPDRTPIDQALIAAGIPPEDVIAIVNSHLHFDHCGQNPMFYGSDVPVFVQQSELETVEQDEFYTDARWATPPVGRRTILKPVEGQTYIRLLRPPPAKRVAK